MVSNSIYSGRNYIFVKSNLKIPRQNEYSSLPINPNKELSIVNGTKG